jgi:4-hydroxybenzoate polyprenyltransferase
MSVDNKSDVLEKEYLQDGPGNELRKICGGWLSLLRIPNLFTLPGDVIIGFMIAESSLEKSELMLGFSFSRGVFLSYSIFYLLIAVFSIYCMGLITNDLADFDEDSEKRPDRPLPSGMISRKAAWSGAFLFLFSALFSAYLTNRRVLIAVLLLAVVVIAYNFFLKNSRMVGAFSLGVCRSLSVMIGFLGAGIDFGYYPLMLYIVSLGWFLYFFIVSLIAYYETEDLVSNSGEGYFLLLVPLLWGLTAPFGSDAFGVVMLLGEVPPGIFLAIGSFTVFSLFVVKNCIILNLKHPSPLRVQMSVGELIRSIIFLQASGCALLGYPYIALALFLLWFPARILAGRFYSS